MRNEFTDTRRAALTAAIAAVGLDLYLVPMTDAFQSEYIPPADARLPCVSGFAGSAGMGAFWAKPEAARAHTLFVDGRYTLQAARETESSGIAVLNSGDTPFTQWLSGQGDALRVGFDPWLITQEQWVKWTKECRAVTWVVQSPNLVDGIWEDRPASPVGEVAIQPMDYAGASYVDKRAALLKAMQAHKADALVLAQPDGINWLLNLRGSDVAYNPLLLCYFVLQSDGKSTLYLNERSFNNEVREYLAAHEVATAPIASVFDGSAAIAKLSARVMMDPATTAHGWFLLAEKQTLEIVTADDPTLLPKARKNPVELAGIRHAHARDGLALTRCLHWFDQCTVDGKPPMELEVVTQLERFRADAPEYRGPSFATIAGSGPNGAIVHYRADEASNRRVRAGELFLLDSGGQYPDGTTDVTRTVFVASPVGGSPAPAMREHFTRVLKGHIALATARFPAGTTGGQLDVLARQFLWQAGLDYDHGTGHGVGAYLCVHEGPQRISKRASTVALAVGMVLSNEPGYYAAGQYGIRIENLVTVVELGQTAEGKPLLGFETLTLAPIDTRLVDVKMLTAEERNWLNSYHQQVYKAQVHALDDASRRWLLQVTRAV